MNLSLDTNVVIELLRGQREQVRARFEHAKVDGATIKLCTIVLYELTAGAMASARPHRHMRDLDILLAAIEIEDWTAEDARVAARLRADLAVKGKGIGSLDTLIAGQALNRGWTMVTANTREFTRIDGLTLEDWTR